MARTAARSTITLVFLTIAGLIAAAPSCDPLEGCGYTGTCGGGSGAGGATAGDAGFAGDAGLGGTAGEGGDIGARGGDGGTGANVAGGGTGGNGGSLPCDGACGGETPVCATDTDECVECSRDADCEPPTPVCDTDSNTCVECRASEECTAAGASRCNAGACEACTTNAHCAHLESQGVCDSGTCVECTTEDEAPCDGNSCNPTTNACTTTPVGSVGECEPCRADSECAGGNLADPDFRCVPMEYQGAARPGGFCLRRVAKTCERPFSVVIATQSLSGAASEGYCGTNQANVRCEAVLDLLRGRSCSSSMDAQCGCARDANNQCTETGQAGLCRTVGPNPNRCTYRCGTDDHCPEGMTCSSTSPRYCQ